MRRKLVGFRYKLITVVLIFVLVLFFLRYSVFLSQREFDFVEYEYIEAYIHKAVNTNLKLDPMKPQCGLKALNPDYAVEADPRGSLDSALVNGSFVPEHCNAILSIAVLISYRNRGKQLAVFLPYIHDFLQRQNIHYKIFVIEQDDKLPWNKGVLYNIGAMVAISEGYPCLILHDVDLLPLDYTNPYACLQQPRHMSAKIDKFQYKLPYWYLVGGVTAITSDQYVQVNGFSNRFTYWGGEDDDFAFRIISMKLNILRLPPSMTRYHMLLHIQEVQNEKRQALLKERLSHEPEDGLSTLKYKSLKVINKTMYEHLLVQL